MCLWTIKCLDSEINVEQILSVAILLKLNWDNIWVHLKEVKPCEVKSAKCKVTFNKYSFIHLFKVFKYFFELICPLVMTVEIDNARKKNALVHFNSQLG